ncbi:S49 family peptidase [Aestuariibius sp. HNIBRBA575]|uniref:S49 family peptidase n=1 Tax=Aestuariibius sp. HNIBRBA575 TaxID=3233343 RepID=UPI0034A1DB66
MKRFIPFIKSDPRVAVIRLNGVIASGGRGLNDATLAPIVEKAFRSKPDAVALVINSPGGSPVQSSLIGARIRRLADEKDIPVYAFVEDVAASGGYWLAAAADEIIVDASSVIGSIGVISSGFGLQDFIAKHGVERRVYTAGTSKSQLDPFKAENPEDIERLKVLLEQIHATFKEHVQSRRGDKLADADLFNGEIWVGHKGVEMGLADHVGHLVPFMKEKFGDKVQFRVLSPSRRSLLSRLSMGIVRDAVSTVEERAAYAQFGL